MLLCLATAALHVQYVESVVCHTPIVADFTQGHACTNQNNHMDGHKQILTGLDDDWCCSRHAFESHTTISKCLTDFVKLSTLAHAPT